MLTLLLFRLVWGFIGSETARFRHFLVSPVKALQTLRGFRQRGPDTQVGHNPAGGWMVLVMLLLLGVQVAVRPVQHRGIRRPLCRRRAAGEISSASRRASLAGDVHAINFYLLAG